MIVVLPEIVSNSIWRYGFVELEVCSFLLWLLPPGGRFVDIGAHFGFFTLLGAHLVGPEGRVLALEPGPRAYRILCRNTATSPWVETCPYAAFGEDEETVLYDYGVEFSAFNSLVGLRGPGGRGPSTRTELTVQARRVDDLLHERNWETVDVVKIDAESSESQVLRGLERTILKCGPAVVVEVGDFGLEGGTPSTDIVAWFQDRGYAPFEATETGILPHHKQDRYSPGSLLFLAGKHLAPR